MGDKIRIIIAEDIDVIRDNYVEMLKDDELEVVGVSQTGAGAFKLFQDIGADIILMDIEMETQTAGIDYAKKIFELSDDVKIIFLSVHEDEKTIINSMATGAVDYMIKSDDRDKIVNHIKRAYHDKVELEQEIQKCMMDEFVRLSKSNKEIISFTKKLSMLTASEREIIKLLLCDYKTKEIADIRCVEIVTIKTQISQLLRKFGVKRTKEIVNQIRALKLDELFS